MLEPVQARADRGNTMCKYRSILENLAKLRSMTGLTADEFHALVSIFYAACEASMKRRTIDGHVR
jgi:hypothetical protein